MPLNFNRLVPHVGGERPSGSRQAPTSSSNAPTAGQRKPPGGKGVIGGRGRRTWHGWHGVGWPTPRSALVPPQHWCWGYQVRTFGLDAWDWGSPQSRSRVFISIGAPGMAPLPPHTFIPRKHGCCTVFRCTHFMYRVSNPSNIKNTTDSRP